MKTQKILYVLAGAVIAAAGLFAYRAYSQAGGDITVCVKKSGAMFMIGKGFKRADCKGNEQIISWNMQGPAGPKGDKGDSGLQGEKGEKGDTGPQGPAEQTLHLFDANSQDLGVLLDIDPGVTQITTEGIYSTYLSQLNLIALFASNFSSGTIISASRFGDDRLHFTEPGCTGEVYVGGFPSNQLLVKRELMDGPRYYRVVGRPLRVRIHSNTELSAPLPQMPCINDAYELPSARKIEEVVLPFAEPLAWPLEIRSAP